MISLDFVFFCCFVRFGVCCVALVFCSILVFSLGLVVLVSFGWVVRFVWFGVVCFSLLCFGLLAVALCTCVFLWVV